MRLEEQLAVEERSSEEGALLLFSGNAHPELAHDVADHLGMDLGQALVDAGLADTGPEQRAGRVVAHRDHHGHGIGDGDRPPGVGPGRDKLESQMSLGDCEQGIPR